MPEHIADPVRMGYRMEKPSGGFRPMTVGDLKFLLKDAPSGAHVMLWSDAEGNQINNLLEVQIGKRAVELVPFD